MRRWREFLLVLLALLAAMSCLAAAAAGNPDKLAPGGIDGGLAAWSEEAWGGKANSD